MTDRMTPDKQQKARETIEQLNKELAPLVVKAVLIDPMMAKTVMADATKAKILGDIIIFIHEIASMVVE